MKQCKICGKSAVARGYCKSHYRAFMRYGDPTHKQNLRGVPFDNRYTKDPTSGCWNWFGSKDSSGYGTYIHKDGTRAHRYSWERANGRKTPDGYCVLHRCDNPACVNPDHLFVGTHEENMKDMRTKGRAVGHAGGSNPSAKLTEEQAIEILEDPRPASALRDHYGVSDGAIHALRAGKTWGHLQTEHPTSYSRLRLTEKEVQEILADPRPQKVIAEQYGVAQATISQILIQHGARRGKGHIPKGNSRNLIAEMSELIIADIICRGNTAKNLAAKYGVSPSTVHKIRKQAKQK